MKHLIVCLLGGVISLSAFSMPATNILHGRKNYEPKILKNAEVKPPVCTVTVNLSTPDSYFCINDNVTYTTLLCSSGTASAVTCTQAANDAITIARRNAVVQLINWSITQSVACAAIPPL